jgi:hypothetical protein
MPPDWDVVWCVWMIRFREKWNIVKIDDDPQWGTKKIGPVDRCSSDNGRKPNPRWLP